jgi:AmiR/NasT family two-component response regulator
MGGRGVMSEKRPDPLARMDSTAEAIGDLGEIFAAEEPLDDVLARVAQSAASAIPDADVVSVTVLDNGDCSTPAATDDRIVDVDQQQYRSGRGPCVEAVHSQHPVRAEIVARSGDWPEFAQAAQQLDISACLSVPLLLGDGQQQLIGSLNVYSYTASAFDPFDEKLMQLFTVTAGQAVANARRWQHSRETVTQLERALTSRAEIDQAKGALMAIHGCSADQAFARLVSESQQRNVKVATVARQLLESFRSG